MEAKAELLGGGGMPPLVQALLVGKNVAARKNMPRVTKEREKKKLKGGNQSEKVKKN
jgi:hypothetical protein